LLTGDGVNSLIVPLMPSMIVIATPHGGRC